ncbi:MAG TPA: hypothetical protein VFZ65_17870 [Planctomycetota bacterium]|nr:hypothetical protein [Planctomycetota bacterium]
MRRLFVTFVLLVGLVLAAPHAVALDAVREGIEEAVSEQLGAPCRIERLGFSWFSGFAVRGLELGNPSGFSNERPCLRLRRAEGDLALLQLLNGKLDLTGSIDGLQVFVERCDDGSTNLGALFGRSGVTIDEEPPPGPPRPQRDHTQDLARVRFDLQLRDALVEIRQGTDVLESLSELSCHASKGFDAQRVHLDLDTHLRPLTSGTQSGRLGVKLDLDVLSGTVDAMLSTAGLELQRYTPLVDMFLPGQLSSVAGLVNGAMRVQRTGRGELTVDGDLSIVGPRLAGPLVRGMDLRGERWTLTPALSLRLDAENRPATFDARRFAVDLGWLHLRGLDGPGARPLLGDTPGVAVAYDLDVDTLAGFGGQMPDWLRGTGSRLLGEVGVPWSAETMRAGAMDFDAMLTQVVASVRLQATRLGAAGFELRDVTGAGELRGGEFRFATAEPTLLNQGGLSVAVQTDLRDLARLPATVSLRWTGGQVRPAATEVLRLVVPLLAGLDADTAQVSGLCDLEFAFAGPSLRAADQNWLQLLGEWSGKGTIGLRSAAVTPAPALSGLLAPLGQLVGAAGQLGDGGRLAIDSFVAPFTLRRGSLETRAARWLAKGKEIGLSGTVQLDGDLDYGFDLSALLRGHKDGERVLQALGGTLPAARLTGSLAAPSLGLPQLGDVLQKGAQNELEARGRELLQRELDKLIKRK